MATLDQINKTLISQNNLIQSQQKNMSSIADSMQTQLSILRSNERKEREAKLESRAISAASSNVTGNTTSSTGGGAASFLKGLSPAAIGTSLGILGTGILKSATGLLKGAGIIAFYPIIKPLADQLGSAVSDGLIELFSNETFDLDFGNDEENIKNSIKAGISTGLIASVFGIKRGLMAGLIRGGFEYITNKFPASAEAVADNISTVFPGFAKALEENSDIAKDVGALATAFMLPAIASLAIGGIRKGLGLLFLGGAASSAARVGAQAVTRAGVLASPIGIAFLASITATGIYKAYEDEIKKAGKELGDNIKETLAGSLEKVRAKLKDTPLESLLGLSSDMYLPIELQGRQTEQQKAAEARAKNQAIRGAQTNNDVINAITDINKILSKVQRGAIGWDEALSTIDNIMPKNISFDENVVLSEYLQNQIAQVASSNKMQKINEGARERNAENDRGALQSLNDESGFFRNSFGTDSFFYKFMTRPLSAIASTGPMMVDAASNLAGTTKEYAAALKEHSDLVKSQQNTSAAVAVNSGNTSTSNISNTNLLGVGNVKVVDPRDMLVGEAF